jgi:NADH-quinone oxidoreductase subunit J
MNIAAVVNFANALAAGSPAVEAVLFYLFAGLTAAAALAVVVSRNIVRMSVALLFALAGVAGLFFLLQAEFLAAVQLVVYVGGTLILIVFGVMLTSKSPFSRFEPSKGEVAIAVALAAILLVTIVAARPGEAPPPGGPPRQPLDPEAAYPIGGLGLALLGEYLLPFELASVILLAVLIGAAYLAKGRHKEHDEADVHPRSSGTGP